MKKLKQYLVALLLPFVLGGSLHAQNGLSIVQDSVVNLPDTVDWGDTLRNMSVRLINNGPLIIGTGTVVEIASELPLVGQFPSLGDIQLNLVWPVGDTLEVPLDDYIISPQNSQGGSNYIVVWPTSPGTQPNDSLSDEYYVNDSNGSITAIIPPRNEPDWTMYPNPASDHVYLDFSRCKECVSRLLIRDQHGRIVKQFPQPVNEIFLEDMPNGIYFLEAYDQYDMRKVRAFVKQE